MARKSTKQAVRQLPSRLMMPRFWILKHSCQSAHQKGKERGFVTHDELNAALPQGELTSEQIEDVMASLSEMGVNVVEATDDVDADEPEAEAGEGRSSGNLSDNDEVVLMIRYACISAKWTVELLSEGEIAIAKRIEAGREMMIGGICESPLAIQALLTWAEQVRDGLPLRDILIWTSPTCA